MSLPYFQSNSKDLSLLQTGWSQPLNKSLEITNALGTLVTNVNSAGVTLSTGVISNLTSISIPAGIWLLFGCVAFPSLPANVNDTVAMISTSPTVQSGTNYDGSAIYAAEVPNKGTVSLQVGPIPVKLSQSTPYYLNAVSSFTGSAPTAQGTIYAIQIGVF